MHMVLAIAINSNGFGLSGDSVNIFIAFLTADSVDMLDGHV